MGRIKKIYPKMCPVCYNDYIGSRKQIWCSRQCRDKKLRNNFLDIVINQHWHKREKEKENDYLVCATFNCGKKLSLVESLAGKHCTHHAHEKELENKKNIHQ